MEKSELLVLLQAERQRHREWEESRRINDVLSQVMTHAVYMVFTLSACHERSICKSHPWLLRVVLFAVAAFNSAWTASLMVKNKICRRFVGVLKDTAVGSLMLAGGIIALSFFWYFGVVRKG